MYVVFDQNKNFISYSDNIFEAQKDLNLYFKEIPPDKSNLLEWRWEEIIIQDKWY